MYAGLYNTAANPDRAPLFFDLLANPLDGPFYWERSAYRHYDRIRIPGLHPARAGGPTGHAPARVPDGSGGYRGQMAVLVKPNGPLGHAYMAAIKPFRHLVVYPPMIREIGRTWRARTGAPAPAQAHL
jgi:hypothetical protein